MFDTAHPLLHQAVLWLFAGLLGWAALDDARDYRIPNRLVLAIAALYPVQVLASPAFIAILPAIVVGAATFAVGLVLFSRALLGGGDVKLMAAVAMWAGPELVMPFLFVMGIGGGILSLLMLLPMRLRSGEVAVARVPVPYGVAISAGGLFVAMRLLTGT